MRVLDAERRQQAALGLALAALERVDARVLRGAVGEREARVVDARGAAPDRELVAEHVAQRVGGLAGLDEHHLRPPAEPPCERARLHERAPVAGRDHHLGKLALRRQKPEMDMLAHFLRWQPHVELVRGPCRHVVQSVRSCFKCLGYFPRARAHQPRGSTSSSVSISQSTSRRSITSGGLSLSTFIAVAGRLDDHAELAQALADGVRPPRAPAPASRGRARGRARGRGPCRAPRRASGWRVDQRLEAATAGAPPTPRAFSCSPSSSITSSTASPIAQETGLPPTEAKKAPWRANALGDRARRDTAPTGRPLPVAFAMVTMSGTTPCCSKPQKCSPSRP